MSSVVNVPTPVLVLEDEDHIRAYVHPTRMRILSLLAREQMTATGLARELGVHPANLTRHLRVLRTTGLIRLVEKRDTGREPREVLPSRGARVRGRDEVRQRP